MAIGFLQTLSLAVGHPSVGRVSRRSPALICASDDPLAPNIVNIKAPDTLYGEKKMLPASFPSSFDTLL